MELSRLLSLTNPRTAPCCQRCYERPPPEITKIGLYEIGMDSYGTARGHPRGKSFFLSYYLRFY